MALVTLRRRAGRLEAQLGVGDEYSAALREALDRKLRELLRNPDATRRFIEGLRKKQPALAEKLRLALGSYRILGGDADDRSR